MLGLFFKPDNLTLRTNLRHSKAFRFCGRHLRSGDGDVGLVLPVPLEHQPVIHFVNMIGSQDQHVLRRFRHDAQRILKHRISRALIPSLANLFHGWDDLDILAQFRRKNAPAIAHVTDQFQRFVLCEDENAAHARVDAIGKGEINDAISASKRNSRFGGVPSERMKTISGSSGQQNS